MIVLSLSYSSDYESPFLLVYIARWCFMRNDVHCSSSDRFSVHVCVPEQYMEQVHSTGCHGKLVRNCMCESSKVHCYSDTDAGNLL